MAELADAAALKAAAPKGRVGSNPTGPIGHTESGMTAPLMEFDLVVFMDQLCDALARPCPP